MNAELIPLELILANPFQVRDKEDPAHVKKIALSIAAEGLLQDPVGRLVLPADPHLDYLRAQSRQYQLEHGCRVELAFGHTRLAAYRLLHSQNGSGYYGGMPVKIRDLTDEQLFVYAVRENEDRADLTPIERARAMVAYRDKFAHTSKEVAELFGCAEETVRGTIRLLNLPENVQSQVGYGITVGTARSLLAVQKVAPQAVEALALQVVQQNMDRPEDVAMAARSALSDAGAVTMYDGRYHSERELSGGPGLWPLSWAPGQLELKFSEFEKLYQGPVTFVYDPPRVVGLNSIAVTLTLKQLFGNALISSWRERNGRYAAGAQGVYDLLDQLTRPPACTACSYYAAIGGTHYCGLKTCWQNKRKAWFQAELERLSLELGVAIYDPNVDGKEYQEIDWQSETKKQFKQWLEQKADHLRLRLNYKEYSPHDLTGSHVVDCVSVRSEYQEKARAQHEKEAAEKVKEKAADSDRQVQNRNRELSAAFLWQVAAPVFAVAFSGVKAGVLPYLARAIERWRFEKLELPETPHARDELTRRYIAQQVLTDHLSYNDLALGPAHVGGELAGVATAWGIRLPADWAAMAERFGEAEDNLVSAETS